MSCDFDRSTHYRELLEAARAGGYRFASFDAEPADGRPVPAPRRRPLARRGAADGRARGRGRRDGDLLPDDRVGLLQPRLRARARRRSRALRELGHRVGLHAVYPRVDAGRALRPGRRLAQPGPGVHVRADRRRGQRDGRHGASTRRPTAPTRTSTGAAAARTRSSPRGAFPWLQLLTHPEIWAYEGATMGETMQRDARGGAAQRSAARATLVRERQDRPPARADLSPVAVVVTASGAPGTAALLRGAARERRARGAPRRHGHVRALDRPPPLRRVPPRAGRAPTPASPDAILEVVEREGVDAVLPQSSFDLEGLAEHRDRFDVAVLVSTPGRDPPLERQGGDATRSCTGSACRRPSSGASTARAAVAAAAASSAIPTARSASSRCSRPARAASAILDPTVDRAHQLLHERPGSVAMRLEEAVELLRPTAGPTCS